MKWLMCDNPPGDKKVFKIIVDLSAKNKSIAFLHLPNKLFEDYLTMQKLKH